MLWDRNYYYFRSKKLAEYFKRIILSATFFTLLHGFWSETNESCSKSTNVRRALMLMALKIMISMRQCCDHFNGSGPLHCRCTHVNFMFGVVVASSLLSSVPDVLDVYVSNCVRWHRPIACTRSHDACIFNVLSKLVNKERKKTFQLTVSRSQVTWNARIQFGLLGS